MSAKGRSADVSGDGPGRQPTTPFRSQLNRVYLGYTAGFFLFVLALALWEQMGLGRRAIGMAFLLATAAIYAGIGILSRTMPPSTTWRAGGFLPCTTGWPPAPIG